MCRSALEYPPNGKRCEKHGSPAEQKARRDARNARRRERYHAMKEEASETPLPPQGTHIIEGSTADSKKDIATQYLSDPESYRGQIKIVNNRVPATAEDINSAMKLGGTQTSPMSYLEITDDDAKFAKDNNSANDVRRLTLEDNSVGYFKGYRAGAEKGEVFMFFGHTALGSANNEVAAYQLSQALGEEYDGLVPETVLREYNGDIGSFQAEVKGVTYKEHTKDADFHAWRGLEKFPVDEVRKIAVLDYLMGAQDRHGENMMVTTDDSGQKHLALIDNGYGFPDSSEFPVNDNLPHMYLFSPFAKPEDKELTETELNGLKQFVKTYENDNVLSSGKTKHVLARAKNLIKEKKLLDINDLNNDDWVISW